MARTWKDFLRRWITSPYFQAAVQLTVGTAVLSLFVFVDKMRFPMSCNAAVIFAAITMALFPNAHMGGRILGSAVVFGCLLLGCAAGGATVAAAWAARGSHTNLLDHARATLHGPPSEQQATLMALMAETQAAQSNQVVGVGTAPKPKMPTLPEMEAFLHQIPIVGGDYYTVLCVMSAITFLFVAVVRSDVESPVGALGATIALLSGLIIAAGGVAVPVIGMARFWTQVVQPVIKLGLVAVCAVVLSGMLVLPSLASRAMLNTIARTVEGVGQCVSRIGTDVEWVKDTAATEKGVSLALPQISIKKGELRQHMKTMLLASKHFTKKSIPPEHANSALDDLRSATAAYSAAELKPSPSGKLGTMTAGSVTNWRRKIPTATLQLTEAVFEPPFFSDIPIYQGRWKEALESLSTMISRASALEDVCKLPLILKAVPRLELLDQGNLTSALRVAQAAVATGCVNLAYCLRNPTDTNPAHAPSPGGLDGSGWDAIQSQLAVATETMHNQFWHRLATVAGTHPRNVDDFEAVQELRGVMHVFMLCGSLVESIQGLEGSIYRALNRPQPEAIPPDVECQVKGVTNPNPKDQSPQPPPQKSGKSSPPQHGAEKEGGGKRELHPWVMWLIGILACMSSAILFRRLGLVLLHVRSWVQNPARIATDLRSRTFIFALKYWVALTGVMIVIVVTTQRFPVVLAPWQLSTTFAVVAVCLQPMVEDTGYKTLLRLALLVAAGLIGFGVMSSPGFACNPAGIMVFLCVVAFMFGHMNGLVAIKYPMFFFMSTLYSMLLCQYTGHSTGTLIYFGSRVLTTLVGSGLCLFFGVLLYPWYSSQNCQEKLALCLKTSVELLDRMWTDFVAAADEAGRNGTDTAMPTEDYRETLVKVIDKNLGEVEEAAKEDVLPFDIPYISERDLITPMPPIVTLALGAISRLSNQLATAQLAVAQQSWRGETETLAKWNTPGLLSRPLGRLYASKANDQLRAYILACSVLAKACQENLEAVRRHPQAASRDCITERLAVAETVRLQLKACLHEIAPQAMELAIQQDSDCFQENVIFESWLASFLRSLDQVLCVARTCLLEECQQRDHYLSWLGCV